MNEEKVITPEDLLYKLIRIEEILSLIGLYRHEGRVDSEFESKWRNKLINYQIPLITKAKKEWEKEDLTKFLYWLLKHGYCDDDVYFEPPTAIDRYLILNTPELD